MSSSALAPKLGNVTQRKVTPATATLQKLEMAQRPSQAALFVQKSKTPWILAISALILFSAMFGYVARPTLDAALPNWTTSNVLSMPIKRQYDEVANPPVIASTDIPSDIPSSTTDTSLDSSSTVDSSTTIDSTLPVSTSSVAPVDDYNYTAMAAQISSELPGLPSPQFSDYDAEGGVSMAGITPVALYLGKTQYEMLFPHRDSKTRVQPYYTYDNFIAAASAYPEFASHSDPAIARRELAAFLANVAFSTLPSDFSNLPGGIEEWGLSVNEERDCCCTLHGCPEYSFTGPVCSKDPRCGRGRDNGGGPWWCPSYDGPPSQYYGRGALMMKHCYNYGMSSAAIHGDARLWEHPNLISYSGYLGWRVAFWQWMNPIDGSPISAHDAMVDCLVDYQNNSPWNGWCKGKQLGFNRPPGFGLTMTILDPFQCGKGETPSSQARLKMYEHFAEVFAVSAGPSGTYSCANQPHF